MRLTYEILYLIFCFRACMPLLFYFLYYYIEVFQTYNYLQEEFMKKELFNANGLTKKAILSNPDEITKLKNYRKERTMETTTELIAMYNKEFKPRYNEERVNWEEYTQEELRFLGFDDYEYRDRTIEYHYLRDVLNNHFPPQKYLLSEEDAEDYCDLNIKDDILTERDF